MKKITRIASAAAALLMAASMAVSADAAVWTSRPTTEGQYYYLHLNGCYYDMYSYQQAISDATALNGTANDVTTIYVQTTDSSPTCTSDYQWINTATNRYYRTEAAAWSANSQGNCYNAYTQSQSSPTMNSTYQWYNSATGYYYKSYKL